MKIQSLGSLFRRSSDEKIQDLEVNYPSFLGFLRRGQTSAEPLPRTSDPSIWLEKQLKEGYRVKIKRGVRKITLFRFLLAKLVYEEEEGIHLDEYVVLMELFYDLMDYSDPSFIKKYGSWISKIKPFFENVASAKEFPVILKRTKETTKLYSKFLEPNLPTQQAYFGLRGNRNLRNSWTLILNSSLTPQRKFHKSVIGVGYRDKGYRRSPHDGTPDWREVCSHFNELLRRISEGEEPKVTFPPWLLSLSERESEE